MVVRMFCDVCGKELREGEETDVWVSRGDVVLFDLDLCGKCSRELQELLNAIIEESAKDRDECRGRFKYCRKKDNGGEKDE